MILDLSTMKEMTVGGVKLSELSINGTKIWQAGDIPAEYAELEYIETDGNQWVDTGVNAYLYNDDTIRYNFKGNVTDYLNSNGNNYLFGCLNNSKRSGNVSLRGTAVNVTYVYVGATTYPVYQTTYMPAIGEDFEVNLAANSNYENSISGDIDGNIFSRTSYTLDESNMPDANIWLCHCNGVGTSSKPFVGKLYSFTMSAADGTPIRAFRPVRRKIDRVVGLYDTVYRVFYENAGTGEFIAGAELAA